MRKGKIAGGSGGPGFENPLDPGQKHERPVTAPFPHAGRSRPASRQAEQSQAASTSYRPRQEVPPSFLMTAAARAKRYPPAFSEAAAPSLAPSSSRQARPATAAAPNSPDARQPEFISSHYNNPHTSSDNLDPHTNIYTSHYGYETGVYSDGSHGSAGAGGSARRADPWTRHKPRGFNPDFTRGVSTAAPVGGGPAQEPGQQGYSARPVYGFDSRYHGAAAWAFRPADYTWRSMTRAEKERAVAAAYAGPRAAGAPQRRGGDAGTSEAAEDPLLRFVAAARGTVDRVDLDHSNAPLVGYKIVAGAPDARLVGGEWRWVPKPAKQLPEGRVWTEHFGPVGGSGPITSYYGKKYDAEGNCSFLVY